MKVFVALPCYDRTITCETARSLLDEQAVASAAGIELRVNFAPGNSLITHARNQCVRDFMQSGCDRLVFVDSDVAWEAGSLLKIALANHPFLGGAYRYKADAEGYPVHFIDAYPEADENGLIEVATLPGGFMSLSRDVFARLFAAHPDRKYEFHGQNFFAFFHCPPGDGEDGAFCRDWRDAGGQIWLDQTLLLTHVDGGGRKYTGRIADYLARHVKPRPERISDLDDAA